MKHVCFPPDLKSEELMLKKPYVPTYASGNRNTVGSGSGTLSGFSGLYNEVMNPTPQEAPDTPDPEIVVPSARE